MRTNQSMAGIERIRPHLADETFAMPELAEVEFYRRQWDAGLGKKIQAVELHPAARVFRGNHPDSKLSLLCGQRVLSSSARGKQMMFRFEKASLGVHLGMTGSLHHAEGSCQPEKHDHLVLRFRGGCLIYRDPRQFGKITLHSGKQEPAWWVSLPPDLLSKEFRQADMVSFLERRARSPLKAVLLMQERFPGVGNWMADEILWRARLNPSAHAGTLDPSSQRSLYRRVREVCQDALRVIGTDWSDPPDSWLFPHRWKNGGHCPRCTGALVRADIGGRTTCWCPDCQP